MLPCFRNTQTQSLQFGFGSSPRAAGAAGPTRPGPARQAGAEAELPRPGQGEGPAGQRRTPLFPALFANMEPPQCYVWTSADLRGTHPRVRESPARPAPQGRPWGGDGGRSGRRRGKRSTLTGRSGGQRGLTTQGPGSSPVSPGAAPSCCCCCSPLQRCHGPRLALPMVGKWRAGRERRGPGPALPGEGAGGARPHGLRCCCPGLSAPLGSPGLRPSRRSPGEMEQMPILISEPPSDALSKPD